MRAPPVNIDLPYIVTDMQGGKLRRFVRLPGKKRRKIRLHAEPNTEAFTTEYWAARSQPESAGAVPKIRPARAGSFRWLVAAYYASPDFAALDKTYTQVERRRQLDPLVEEFGDRDAVMDPKTIRNGVKDRKSARARKFVAALRHMYGFAVEAELVVADPTAGIRAKKIKTDGFHSWTLEECLAYETRWPIGTKQRTAYAIGLYLMPRRSDAVRLGSPMVRAGGASVAYRQHKNRNRAPVWVEHPIIPPLAEALAAWKGKELFWLTTASGDPYSVVGFGNAFSDWCRLAGLPRGCSFHGLRKATAARMAELGRTTKEIQAALGDKTLQQADVYTRAADNARLAGNAFEGMYAAPVVEAGKATA